MSSFRALNVLSALNVLNVSNVPITVSLSHLLEQCDYESPYEKALGSNVLAFFCLYTPHLSFVSRLWERIVLSTS